MPKIQGHYLCFTIKSKKYTFFGLSLAVMKTRRKSLLFFIKSLILFGFFFDISEPIFLSNIYISLIAQKLEREISRVFPALCLSLQRRKSIFFTSFAWCVWRTVVK